MSGLLKQLSYVLSTIFSTSTRYDYAVPCMHKNKA